MNIKLRDYQLDGINKIRQSYIDGHKAPVYVLSTGAGKTCVFCNLVERVQAKGNRVYILVHRSELLNQTSTHLNYLGVDHGLIASGKAMTGDKVQIASVQTIVRRLDKLPKPNIIIIDEAHHAAAKSWKTIINHFSDAYILGVTATPQRYDGKGLGKNYNGCFDTMVEGPNINELISMGYLTPAITYKPPTPLDMHGVKVIAGDYDKKEAAKRIDRPVITGCAVEHYNKLCNGLPAIAFCQTIKHAENVSNQFNNAGIPSLSIDGTLSNQQRKYRIDCLANGKIKVLTSCDLISEGIDIPVVSAVILLRPTMSLSIYLQQVGRALRSAPQIGKIKAIILDHVGNCERHGLYNSIHKWTLEGEAKKKRKDKEISVDIRQCKACYAVYPSSLNACPQCGQVYMTIDKKIKQIKGELIQVTDTEIKEYGKDKRREVGKARTLEELRAIARKRDYHYKWADRLFNIREAKRRYA